MYAETRFPKQPLMSQSPSPIRRQGSENDIINFKDSFKDMFGLDTVMNISHDSDFCHNSYHDDSTIADTHITNRFGINKIRGLSNENMKTIETSIIDQINMITARSTPLLEKELIEDTVNIVSDFCKKLTSDAFVNNPYELCKVSFHRICNFALENPDSFQPNDYINLLDLIVFYKFDVNDFVIKKIEDSVLQRHTEYHTSKLISIWSKLLDNTPRYRPCEEFCKIFENPLKEDLNAMFGYNRPDKRRFIYRAIKIMEFWKRLGFRSKVYEETQFPTNMSNFIFINCSFLGFKTTKSLINIIRDHTSKENFQNLERYVRETRF